MLNAILEYLTLHPSCVPDAGLCIWWVGPWVARVVQNLHLAALLRLFMGRSSKYLSVEVRVKPVKHNMFFLFFCVLKGQLIERSVSGNGEHANFVMPIRQ